MTKDRKLSEIEGEEREQALAYVKGRWSQYYSATREVRKDAATLIAAINAGGAAAGLAFAGAVIKETSALATSLSLKLAISFFVLGTFCSALAHAFEHGRLSDLFKKWRSAVARLYVDEVGFDKMQREDEKRSGEREGVAVALIWIALVCFGVGAVLGILLFFKEPDMVKDKQGKPTPAPQQTPARPFRESVPVQEPPAPRPNRELAPDSPPPPPPPPRK